MTDKPTKLEEVARAIDVPGSDLKFTTVSVGEFPRPQSVTHLPTGIVIDIDDLPKEMQSRVGLRLYLQARLAIEALLEPTDEMLTAGLEVGLQGDLVIRGSKVSVNLPLIDVFNAMLNKVLEG